MFIVFSFTNGRDFKAGCGAKGAQGIVRRVRKDGFGHLEFMIRRNDLVLASVSVQTKVRLGKTIYDSNRVSFKSTFGSCSEVEDSGPTSALLRGPPEEIGYGLEEFITCDQDVLGSLKKSKRRLASK